MKPECDFHIYEVQKKVGFGIATYLVLSKDIQSALSTIPEATSVRMLRASCILINKAVAREIVKASGKRKCKE